jgi:hypothetical protein
MKLTLLEIVQDVMSALESDEIASINDSNESQIIANLVKHVYFQMISNKTIPEHQQLVQLTDAGATAKVFMKIPDTVNRIEWIKYNKIGSGETDLTYGDVQFLPVYDFMNVLVSRHSSDANVVSATDPTSSFALDLIANDAAPRFWTSFDDQYICFDSYDALVATKTLCWGTIIPVWTAVDAFTPDMDDNFFPGFLAECISTAFQNLKQQSNPKVEQQARRQRTAIQNDKYRTRSSEKEGFSPPGPNYGRKPRGGKVLLRPR